MRDLIKRIVRESTREMKEARRYPTYEMNEDSFARVFEFFLNELKNNTGFSHAKMRKSLILTIRMWTEKPPQLISKTVLDYFIENHPNINPFKVTFRPRGKFGIDVIFEHTTPVNLFVINLFKSKNIEDIKRVMGEYSGMSIITREEDLCLHSKGFSKNRPQGWEQAYAECDIEVMTEDEFNMYKNEKQSQIGDRDLHLNEDKALYTVEELRQLALKYQNFKEFLKNEPKALAAIRRKGKDFENELTGHMDRSHYKNWSDDDLRREALKYQTISDFQKNSGSAAFTARQRGDEFFKDITNHMIVKKKSKWTDKELEDEAKKYQTITDFRKNSPKAAAVARIRGREFYDKITLHLQPTLIQWTDEMLRDEAKKYKNKAEFRKKSPKAYAVANTRSKEFWDDITSHMIPLHTTWNKEKLRNEALKFQTLADFYRFGGSAPKMALKIGREFYEDITKHMDKLTLWTDEMLKNEALKYKTKSDFQRKSGSAYMAALKRGILNDITVHMEPMGNKYKRLIYAYEFPDNHIYVGLTYNLNKRDRSHTQKETSAVYRHIQKTGLKPIRKSLTDFLDKNEAVKKENEILDNYIKKGWIPLNIAKTGSLGGGDIKWTDDAVRSESQKYTHFNDFYKNSRSAFNAAKNRGDEFFNEVTSHLIRKIEYSTDDQLKQRALMYKTKSDFMKNDPSSYQKARRRGEDFFKSITSHMEPMRKKWTDENLRSEALKYTSRKEFHNNAPSAYNAAKSKGDEYFYDITSHMRDMRKK